MKEFWVKHCVLTKEIMKILSASDESLCDDLKIHF